MLVDLKLVDLDDLFMEIGLGNQMSSVIAHRLLGESIEIDTDGNPDNNSSPLEINANGGLFPSGTEPKIKFYIEVRGEMKSRADYYDAETKADRKIDAVRKDLGI